MKEKITNNKYRVVRTDEDWKKILTPEQFNILREKATERPFTGEYDDFFENGIYVCAGCGELLFTSNSKFNSGCGWPAFDKEAEKGNIEYEEDNSFGMHRVEIICSNCGGHLGHLFNDGPTETGMRYCVNSASLKFNPEK